MIERGRGHLVTISSTAGLIGVFGYSAYAPAKFAVRGLTETLRAELAPHGIVVACAYPPDTRTPGLDAENELKPPETERISAAIKPREAARRGQGDRRAASRRTALSSPPTCRPRRWPGPPGSSAPTCAAPWTARSAGSARSARLTPDR